MTRPDVIGETRAFIRENFLYTRPDFDLRPELPLLGAGIIDSMGVVELIEFLQERFGVAIEDGEITEENLGTLTAIDSLVQKKLAAPRDGLHAA